MKKFVMLFSFTALAVLTIVAFGNSVKNSVVRVSAVKVIPNTVENTVTCTGRVESYPGNDVYASKPGIVQKIYVKSGDKVIAGQAIMDVLPLPSTSSALSSSPSPDYSNMYQAYAAYLQSHTSSLPSGTLSSSMGQNSDSAAGTASQEYTLIAGNSGTVESVTPSAVGAYIDATSPAAVVRNENGMQVRLSVDESQISDIKEGQKVQITGTGFKSVYSGTIKSISDEAKQTVLTTGQETVVEVIAAVNNPGDDIKPGFTAKAKIATSQNNHIVTVPYEAVREDEQEKEYVLCAVGGKAKKIVIVTGKEFDTGFEVKKGLSTGDIVITDPDDVCDGSKVVVARMTEGDTHE